VPELPEVETIKNDLRPELEGRQFTSVSILWPRMVLTGSPERLGEQLVGQQIQEVARRGKYLVFRLAGGRALVLHMRMTGSLLLRSAGESSSDESRYLTAVFGLDSGQELLFCDRRKLGTVSLVDSEAGLDRKLGPEPLDRAFTARALQGLLAKRKAPIKAILCDQDVIAGIGNMYADEALFSARIHPLRPANSLSDNEISRLRSAITGVLRKGIRNAGASFSDYRRPSGDRGSQQDAFHVAHRGGETCSVCATPIERIPVRNRGTYYCPKCQGNATCSGSSASSSP
jgi:formamidopyrimidine-DNA glycosylase